MANLFYRLGQLYVRAPFPLYVSVLLTLGVLGMLIYWVLF